MDNMIKTGLSRRGFLGGVAAFGALAGGGTRLFAADAEKPLLRFGVVSDVHVRLAPGGGSLHPDYDTETLEKAFTFFRDNDADAVTRGSASFQTTGPPTDARSSGFSSSATTTPIPATGATRCSPTRPNWRATRS